MSGRCALSELPSPCYIEGTRTYDTRVCPCTQTHRSVLQLTPEEVEQLGRDKFYRRRFRSLADMHAHYRRLDAKMAEKSADVGADGAMEVPDKARRMLHGAG